MKQIIGLLLCLVSAGVTAAEVSGSASVLVKGSVIAKKIRTCTFDLAAPSNELAFDYYTDSMPNHYFLMMNGLNFSNQVDGAYLQYFEKIGYALTCNFKPESNNVVSISYQAVTGKVSALSGSHAEYFLASAESERAGFLIYSNADLYWLNIKNSVSSSTGNYVSASKFIGPSNNGDYTAEIGYSAAFVALPTALDLSNVLAPTIVSAGTYTANLGLTVKYN